MHSSISSLRPPLPNIIASTPTRPSPQSQPQPHDRASSPPPQRPKKRSSDEAGNDTTEVRTTKRHGRLSSLYFTNTALPPNPRPTKKAKGSQNHHTNAQPIPLSLYQQQKPPPYRQSFQISPMQQHIFEHIPPSQQLVDATTYQPKPKPLLAPIIGTKRAWSDAARDGAWGSYECVAPVRKKARIEEVFIVNG